MNSINPEAEVSVNALPEVRRVVTAINANGRSYIAEDGPPPRTVSAPGRPGYLIRNLWTTSGTVSAARIAAPDDGLAGYKGVHPPKHGTVIRIIDYPPRHPDPEVRQRQAAALYKEVFPDLHHDVSSPNAGMHTTKTVDYAIVLKGTMTALLDEGTCELHEGDVLIQRGTSHAWENRSSEMVRMAYILIDGE